MWRAWLRVVGGALFLLGLASCGDIELGPNLDGECEPVDCRLCHGGVAGQCVDLDFNGCAGWRAGLDCAAAGGECSEESGQCIFHQDCAPGVERFCDGDHVKVCEGGTVTSAIECSRMGAPCREAVDDAGQGVAACAISDERCVSDAAQSFDCHGNAALVCDHGLPAYGESCGSATCVLFSTDAEDYGGTLAVCVLPEPPCASTEVSSGECRDNTSVNCVYGLVTAVQSCAGGSCIVSSTGSYSECDFTRHE
jgi:hypothetical protein